MKNFKRIAAMAAAMTLAACTAAPVFTNAASVSVSVNTTGTDTNNKDATDVTHTYKAFEIFKGENVQTAGADTVETSDDKYEFRVTDLGVGVNWTTLFTENSDFMKLSLGGKTVAEVIGALGDNPTNSAKAKALAQVIGDNITVNSAEVDADALAKIFEAAKTGDGISLSSTAENVSEGYYLITDTYTDSPNNDAVSKFILKVAKKQGNEGIVIEPKKSYPTVEKKVKENVKGLAKDENNNVIKATYENGDDKWNDVADYNIGDAVPFKLYGTMPITLNDYAHYYYKFTDTLGTQFNQPTELTIKIGNSSLKATWDATNEKYVIVGDTNTNCRVNWNANTNTLTISFEDIKAYGGVTSSTVVTVEYDAVLNNTAYIGLPGQVNTVKLAYSNNPNIAYNPNTSDTTEDVPKDDNGTPNITNDDNDAIDETTSDSVIVFTYELDVTKIDGITKENLSGAKFKLYNSDNKAAVVDSDGKFVKWVTEDSTASPKVEGSVLTSGSYGKFKVIGIDDGTYTLTETEAPDKYNKLSDSISLVISAETANNQNWGTDPKTALLSIKLGGVAQDVGDANGNRGHVSKTVENNKGSTLPSTGGMGTYLFYGIGGAIAIGAGVVLISKKRSKDEE